MKHARFAFASVILVALFVCEAAAVARVVSPNGGRTASGGVQQVIQNVVTQYQTQATYPVAGIAIVVIYKGTPYPYYAGVQDLTTKVSVTSSTLFELGSVTKTFTAIETAQAYLSKRLDFWQKGGALATIDLLGAGNVNPGQSFLNGHPCPTPTVTPIPPSDYGVMTQVTVEQLATHTSTLPDIPTNPFASPTPGPTLPDGDRPCYSPQRLMNFVESYVPTPPPSPIPSPGQVYSYSDIGYGTLGYVLQGVYKRPWYAVTQKQIATPLGMTETWDLDHIPPSQLANYATPYTWQNNATFQWPPDAWPAGGALRSTIPDMTNYLSATMGLSGSRKLRQAIALTQQPFFLIKPPSDFQDLAWMTSYGGTPYRVTSKDGGTAGFSSWIGIINPPQPGVKQPIGIVVLTNQSGAPKSQHLQPVAPNLGLQVLEQVAALAKQQ